MDVFWIFLLCWCALTGLIMWVWVKHAQGPDQ